MGAATFIYLTNILLNFISVLPFLFFTTLIYFFIKFLFEDYEHYVTNSSVSMSYFLFSKKCLISFFVYMSVFVMIPNKEVVLAQIEFAASEMFAEDQNESLKFYEFINRMK